MAKAETTVRLKRTVTPVGPKAGDPQPDSRSLADFESAPAYVLLGDPGAGKTTVFKAEAERAGGVFLTARRFLRSPDPAWKNKTLFLDALDEVRAGRWSDPREAMDKLLRQLEKLGNPSARISCRAADWLTGDAAEIRALPGYAETHILLLDPLDASAALELLRTRRPHDAEDFFQSADKRGLSELLRNPLSLRLLSKGVEGDRWPSTRHEAFEQACRSLAREYNTEHRDANRGRFVAAAPEKVLANAVHLSALLLLSEKQGVARNPTGGLEGDWLCLDDVGDADQEALEAALSSKLFVAHGLDHFVPVHGHVAEFLAARRLSQAIDKGLPATRVLALMRGVDGGIVAPLRGLAAWLASLCSLAANAVIDSDPVGVLAYGDPAGLSDDNRRHLLRRLGERSKELRRDPWAYSDFAAASLAAPAMTGMLRDYLEADARSPSAQTVVRLLLEGMAARREADGPSQGGRFVRTMSLSLKELIATARDASWSMSVRIAALRAAGASVGPSALDAAEQQDAVALLEDLLGDLLAERVSDIDQDLQGVLLGCLYPHRIAPEDIWKYLDEWPDGSMHGGNFYGMFWQDDLLRLSRPGDFPKLLDALCEDESRSAGSRPEWLSRLTWRLVAAAIDLHGESMPSARLLQWIKFAAYSTVTGWEHDAQERREDAADTFNRALQKAWKENVGDFFLVPEPNNSAPMRSVQMWLAKRPNTQYGLLLEFFRQDPNNDWLETSDFQTLIFGRAFPADFPRWCLQQALAQHDVRPEVSRHLITWAVEPLRLSEPESAWLPKMLKEVEGRKALKERLTDLARHDREQEERAREAYPPLISEEDARTAQPGSAPSAATGRKQRRSWAGPRLRPRLLERVHSHKDALLRGDAPSDLLHVLARVYLEPRDRPDWDDGQDDGAEAGGIDHLLDALDGDGEAVEWAAMGLRQVLDRNDLLSVEDLIRLDERRNWSFLTCPVLASIDILNEHEDAIAVLDTETIRTAIACHLLDLELSQELPPWFRQAVESRPDDVADVFLATHRSFVRAGNWRERHVRILAEDASCANIAKMILPQLLALFPTRCNDSQLSMLRQSLLATIRHVPSAVVERVQNRAEAKGMDTAQRSTWLAAGILVAPNEFTARTTAFIEAGRGNSRARHLIDLLSLAWRPSPPVGESLAGVQAIDTAALFKTLARRFPPWWLLAIADGTQTIGSFRPGGKSGEDTDLVISRLLGALARNPAREATTALESLLADDALEAWHGPIDEVRDDQVERRRNAEYRAPNVDQVEQTLGNALPANAADLAAVAVDRMGFLRRQIRDSSTSDWKQYWNVDQYGRPNAPRPENQCRDAFLSGVKPLLPKGVSAEPEGRVADDGVADIIFRHDGLVVPMEAKTSMSRDLWSAIGNQLAEYVRIPESAGHGIYLVFWFGKRKTQTPPPESQGRIPETREELERALVQSVPAERRDLVSVVVVDVSKRERPEKRASPPARD